MIAEIEEHPYRLAEPPQLARSELKGMTRGADEREPPTRSLRVVYISQPQFGRISSSKDILRSWLDAAFSYKTRQATLIQDFTTWRYGQIVEQFGTLDEVERAVEESRSILKLGNDWDGAGSLGYAENTWNRARTFVMKAALEALANRASIPPPKILPGPDGSIDVHWKTKYCELLVNVPANSDQRADFYGDDYGSLRIKGTIDPENPSSGLLFWLTSKV